MQPSGDSTTQGKTDASQTSGTNTDVGGTTTTLTTPTPGASAAPTLVAAPGARAAKIIFKSTYPAGSFDNPLSPNGTAPVPGSGLQAKRLFNADGSLLAQGGTLSTNWPKWLSSFEIGLSGQNNPASPNSNCARFAEVGEDTAAICDFGGGFNRPCGAGAGLFRVSEADCSRSGQLTSVGNGGPNDGIYLRATFKRDDPTLLAPHENILVVLEYASSVVNAAPSNPTACFTNGAFTPTDPNCADMSWQVYMKHNLYEMVQPYLMLVPPAFAYINTTAVTGGSGVSTRQFFLPLAGDPNLTVLQISRINAIPGGPGTVINKYCINGVANPANSALCMGMVFYSMTFYRI